MNSKKISRIFKALADPNRLEIVKFLLNKDLTCEVVSCCCSPDTTCIKELAILLKITPATASHHVKEMVAVGIISVEKDGKWRTLKLNHEVFSEITALLQGLRRK